MHWKIGNALLCICCGFNPDELPASVVKKKKRRWMSRNKHLESLDQDWMVMIDIALLCSNKQLFSHLLLKDFSCSLIAFFTGFLWEWILRKIPKAWVLLCLASLVHLLWCNSRPHSFQKLLFYVKLSFQLSVFFFFLNCSNLCTSNQSLCVPSLSEVSGNWDPGWD